MWQQELVDELMGTGNGQKSRVIAKYTEMTGKSAQTLYRIAKKHGYQSRRKQRSDTGACGLTLQQINFIAGLIHTSAREVKGTIMPVDEALTIAEDNGVIDPGTISASRLTAILRERGVSRRIMDTPEPKIQMRSLHPNHVHVVDASICIQFYLKKGQPLQILRQDKFYKNKFENFGKIKRKLIRYVVTDHFSHHIFVKYYLAAGENSQNFFDVLTSAWRGGHHEKTPFRGVPFFLLMDAGAANTAKSVLNFLRRLEVEIPGSLPHNASRQGSAEKAQEIVETRFESKLKIHPVHSLDELNSAVLDWCAGWNAGPKHSRTRMSRTQCWLTIKKEQLRELPDDKTLQYLFANPKEKRKVGSRYSISFRNNEYDLRHIPNIIPNHSRVDVIMRPFSMPDLTVVFNDTEYTVKPIARVAGGFREDAAVIGEEYKALPETVTMKSKKQMENLAFGEEKPKDAAPFAGLTVFGNRAAKVPHEFITRRGVDMGINAQSMGAESEQISIMAFLKRLREAGVKVSPEMNQAIRGQFGNFISRSESDRLMDAAVESGRIDIDMLGGENDTVETIAV